VAGLGVREQGCLWVPSVGFASYRGSAETLLKPRVEDYQSTGSTPRRNDLNQSAVSRPFARRSPKAPAHAVSGSWICSCPRLAAEIVRRHSAAGRVQGKRFRSCGTPPFELIRAPAIADCLELGGATALRPLWKAAGRPLRDFTHSDLVPAGMTSADGKDRAR